MKIFIPMLPNFRPVYDDRGRLAIPDDEYANILRVVADRGIMRCMMGNIAHDVDLGIWVVSVSTD